MHFFYCVYVASNLNTLTIVRWDYSAGESNGSSSTCLSTCLSRRSVALRSVCTPGRVKKKKKSPLLLVLLPPRSLCAHLLACMCECVHLRAHVPQVCARMRELCACWSLHTHTHTEAVQSQWMAACSEAEGDTTPLLLLLLLHWNTFQRNYQPRGWVWARGGSPRTTGVGEEDVGVLGASCPEPPPLPLHHHQLYMCVFGWVIRMEEPLCVSAVVVVLVVEVKAVDFLLLKRMRW